MNKVDTRKLTGAEFKKLLIAKTPKFGVFLNSNSPIVAEQMSQSGYDWILVDTQHAPSSSPDLMSMLSGISNGRAKSFVRVSAPNDRHGIQQALDQGADGILAPYINTREDVEEAVSYCLYPEPSKHKGCRSIFFPQRCMFQSGLLGYATDWNKNVIIAVQVETHDCIKNIDDC